MTRGPPDAPQDRPLKDPQDAVQRDRPQDAPQQPADSAPTPTAPETRPEWGTVLFTWALTAGMILVAVLFAVGVDFVLSNNPHYYPHAPLRW
jgi:hypothetical protein